MLAGAVLAAILLGAAAAAEAPLACGLPGAVPPEQRRNLTVEGASARFGLKQLAWASGRIAAQILGILAQEMLGVHSTILPETAESLTALYAVGGCQGVAPTRVCGYSEAHAALEVWDTGLHGSVEAMRARLGDRMPEDMGSIGYDGFESVFIPSGPKVAALNAEGLSLDFYASFNRSWHNPAPYFHRYSDIPTSGLVPCSETRFYKEDIARYLELTGDADGVEVVNGTIVAKCEGGASGYWWFSPACRAAPQTCVPFITTGNGWHNDPMMQRAAAYNMPLALASATWDAFVAAPRSVDTLFYWWVPDVEFIDLRPMSVKFPNNDKSAWANKSYLTESARVTCRKWAHPALGSAYSRLRDLIANLQLTSMQIDDMLAELKTNSSKTEAVIACDWLKANPQVWNQWIPSETKCSEGWGLISTTGDFVLNRSQASSCKWCPPGTFSRKTTDESGVTHVCAPCSQGEHQPSPTQVQCLPCAPGSFADRAGASMCRDCAVGRASADVGSSSCGECKPGSFQAATGSTSCDVCPAGSFQGAAGATGCRECGSGSHSGANATVCEVCAVGTAAPKPGSERCTACPRGSFAEEAGSWNCSVCPIGEYAEEEGSAACRVCGGGAPLWTTMRRLAVQGEEKWVSTDGATTAEACGCDVGARYDEEGRCVECESDGIDCPGMGEVMVLPGFYSPPRLSVFRCESEARCPGGPPGLTCAPGRVGTGCEKCAEGSSPNSDGDCVPCKGEDKIPFAMAALGAVVACLAMYAVFEHMGQEEPTHGALLAGISIGLLVGLMQQLSVLGLMNISYKEPLKTFLAIMKVCAFDVDDILRFSCIGDFSSVAKFTSKVCLIIAAMALVALVHVGFVLVRHGGRFRERRPVLISVFGTLAMVFYISVTLTILRPLQCNLNPNGKWNNHMYEDVICWAWDEDEGGAHLAMLVISMFTLFFPVSLLAGVVVLSRRFPGALRRGDVDFLRSYGFLFFRFRPQAHWYILVIMCRSLFVGIVPVIPQPTMQIYLYMLALQLTLEAAIHFKPWRVRCLNFLDTAFGTIVVMFLTLTALIVEERDLDVLGWICVLSVVVAMSLIPAIIAYAACKRFGKVSKVYQFFLCHAKADAGAFARWMKMELQASESVQRDVFFDADNLESLDRLLSVVATEVQTLLLLGSRSAFFRPWCIGEMTTAIEHSVGSQVLALPGMPVLDESTIGRLESYVPDIECLLDIGLRLDSIRKALSAFSQKPSIKVPMGINAAGAGELVDMLARGVQGGGLRNLSNRTEESRKTVIVGDLDSFEANAAAHVLQKLLVSYTCHDASEIPQVLSSSQDISPDTQRAIVVCTSGCFSQAAFVARVVRLSDREVTLLPVIADTDFRVPTRDAPADVVVSGLPQSPEGQERSALEVSRIVLNLFKEIAVVFNPKYATTTVLDATVARVGDRLTSKRTRNSLNPLFKQEDAAEKQHSSTTAGGVSRVASRWSEALAGAPPEAGLGAEGADGEWSDSLVDPCGWNSLTPEFENTSACETGECTARSSSVWRESLADASALARNDFAIDVLASLTRQTRTHS